MEEFKTDMAGSSSVDDFQTALHTSLVEIGYSGSVVQLPPSLSQNEKLLNFVDFVNGKINSDHFVSHDELARYHELKSAGATLGEQSLQNVLTQLNGPNKQTTSDAAAQEVEEMKRKVIHLKTQLSNLMSVKGRLSECHTNLTHERDDLARQKMVSQQHYHTTMDIASQDNTEVNKAASDLETSVHSVCSFHKEEGVESSCETTPKLLCRLSQDLYHSSEDSYLSELTTYTKEQFVNGVVSMATLHAPDDSSFIDLDISDTAQVLLRGVSQEQHQRHCQEVARLQAVYPVTEMKYANALISKQYALSATSKAKEELVVIEQSDGVGMEFHDTLRRQISAKQSQISHFKTNIMETSKTVLPLLLRDMSMLAITKVLHGNHDLKLARQDYLTSKLTKVIRFLQSQRARQELLSMMYEIELRRHRETHRLLSATHKQLMHWNDSHGKRSLTMAGILSQDTSRSRVMVDSKDLFTQRVCSLLCITPGPDSPFISVDALKAVFKHLSEDVSTKQAVIESLQLEQSDMLLQQELLATKFQDTFPNKNRSDLTNQVFQGESTKLTSLVTSMERSLKALLKKYDGYRRTIHANSSLVVERELFIHFFNNPTQLQLTIAELNSKVDKGTA